MTTFAERLKNAMEQANMSQSALSEQVLAGRYRKAVRQGQLPTSVQDQ